MHKSTTLVAISVAALAIACDRPAGEDSAADMQQEKPELDPAEAPGAEMNQPSQQQAEAKQPAPGMRSDNVRASGELRVVEITADPDAHVASTVVVVGEVKDMLGEHAFKLNDEAPLTAGQDNDLVVLGTEQASWKMDDSKGDARMRVKGKIARVPTANLKQQLGWSPGTKLQEEIEGEKVILIAETVERLEGGDQQRANERGDTTKDEREGVRGEDQPEMP